LSVRCRQWLRARVRQVVDRVGVVVVACLAAFVAAVAVSAAAASARNAAVAAASPTATTLRYVTEFYPRWVSAAQEAEATHSKNINKLFAPTHMSPVFGFVVAPNDDTLYAASFVDVSAQPVIVTIPRTRATYSVLSMDMYGNVFPTLRPGTPGRYAITGPGWTKSLPPGVTRVPIPVSFSFWIIRADKYSPQGVNQIGLAEAFRQRVRLATLSDYKADRRAGATKIKPTVFYVTRFQLIAAREIAHAPIIFLRQLQKAVHNPNTPPLTGSSLALSNRFDRLFGNGHPTGPLRAELAAATKTAHARFIAHYLAHTDSSNWVFFDDIGAWGSRYADRSATTAYLQYSNTLDTAAYFQAFRDGSGAALNASRHGFVLTFAKHQLPRAKRFWSLTAYLPQSITLVRNRARKYLVASYTPGLRTSRDGSLSIYMSSTKPAGVPQANWLPVPAGPFNVVLRVYGPKGRRAYVPPAIQPLP
jgi:hypothetical protein